MQISVPIFVTIRSGPNGILRGSGKLISEKIWSWNLVTCPFKSFHRKVFNDLLFKGRLWNPITTILIEDSKPNSLLRNLSPGLRIRTIYFRKSNDKLYLRQNYWQICSRYTGLLNLRQNNVNKRRSWGVRPYLCPPQNRRISSTGWYLAGSSCNW
jgi:hypothetical protein